MNCTHWTTQFCTHLLNKWQCLLLRTQTENSSSWNQERHILQLKSCLKKENTANLFSWFTSGFGRIFLGGFVAAAYIGRGKAVPIPVYKRFINLRDWNYTFFKKERKKTLLAPFIGVSAARSLWNMPGKTERLNRNIKGGKAATKRSEPKQSKYQEVLLL